MVTAKECCDFLVPRKKEVTYTLDIENPAWVPLGVGGIMTYVWYGLLSIPFLGNLLSSIYTFILSVFGLKPKEAVGSSPPLDYTLPLYFFPLSDQALLLGFLPLGWLWIGLIKISFGAFEPIYSLILGLWFGLSKEQGMTEAEELAVAAAQAKAPLV